MPVRHSDIPRRASIRRLYANYGTDKESVALRMAGYFVSGELDLRIEVSLLAAGLAQRWPSMRFLERNDEANTARWAVRMPSERELYGELQETGQAIELEGDVYDAAEFARWVRTQIPERYPLYFFDEGFTNKLLVTAQSSTEELAQPFVAQR